MSNTSTLKASMFRIIHLPIVRILIGILICGTAMLVTNSLLRLVLGSEGDIVRILRWVLSSVALFFTYYYFFRYYEKREISELNPDYFWSETFLGFSLGLGLIILVILLLYLFEYYTILSMGKLSVLTVSFMFFVTAAALEEVIFRGIIYRIIETTWGTRSALIVSAVLFGMAHVFNDHVNAISIISAASGGVFLGLLYSLKGRLWLPIAFHAGWNWTQGSLGSVVSGNGELPLFLDVRIAGPELITGGAFGMENSIITVVFILIASGIAAALLMKKQRDLSAGEHR